jgi:methionyl-tRNA formyltransferase
MTSTPTEVVLVGGGRRALEAFEYILNRDDVKIQYYLIQEDYPDEKQIYTDIVDLAVKQGVPHDVHASGKRLPDEKIENVQEYTPDVILGAGIWRSYLPGDFWKTSKKGYIGIHGSLLPKYRGWANINWYMINGEEEYGICAYRLNESIDGGDLVYDKKTGEPVNATIEINEETYISDLLESTVENHVELIDEVIDLIINDRIVFIKQDGSTATYTCHRGPEDGEIDWSKGSRELFNFIRAQSQPYPGAFSFYKNKKFTIYRSEIPQNGREYVGRIPGKVVKRHDSGEVDVITGDGLLRLTEIGVDGESVVPKDFLDSVRESLGYKPREEIKQLKKRVEQLESEV